MLKVRSFNFSDFPVLGSGGGGPAQSGRGSEGRSQGSHEEQGGGREGAALGGEEAGTRRTSGTVSVDWASEISQ